MGASGNGDTKDEPKTTEGEVSIQVSASNKTLLGDENPSTKTSSQDSSLPSVANRAAFLKFGSASAKFRKLARDKDDASRLVASSSSRGFRERIHGVLAKKIDWGMVLKMSKEWIRDPMNLALFVWILCVAISGMSESRPPEWSGGILDFWDDISLAYLSLFCSFCVFGWNMERLGMGNMYVHIATFLLFCMAPFWIFNLAAVNIDDEIVREALGVAGLVLCLFGLLYGGFWRIQIRKRFNLPAYTFCFGKPGASDCILWLCCCWCSLAQEVRTGNGYDIVENKLLQKGSSSQSGMPADTSHDKRLDVVGEEEKDEAMTAPSPSVIERDGGITTVQKGE
ncbi:hypothetical protein LINGRAHAP2_LOCUS25991 [Linum grandiflorum]